MVAPAEHFSPIELPDTKANGEIAAPRGMPNTMVSGEIIVDDEKELTPEEIDKKTFGYIRTLYSRSLDAVNIHRNLADKHPDNKGLMLALEEELKTRCLLNTCLSPFGK